MAFHSLCFLCHVLLLLSSTASLKIAFDAIYQFGDSLSDAGNFLIENPTTPSCSSLPYGGTLFHHPTGRCSDGFLVVDFLAKAFDLPLLNLYLKKDANFDHGVNFAVCGAAAMDTSVLEAKNITPIYTNHSLSVQIGWFKTHRKSICSSKEARYSLLGQCPYFTWVESFTFDDVLRKFRANLLSDSLIVRWECKHKFGKALFVVGEVGGNDYNYAILGGKSVQDLYKLVPDVVHFIKVSVEELIDQGAVHVLVPGTFRFGCAPYLLSAFASNDTSMYDHFKCLKNMNELTEFHNRHLQKAIKQLQEQHPSVTISYGDIDSAYMWLLQNAASIGFEEEGLLKACCGNGNNAYDYNFTRFCGSAGVLSCSDPKKRISWDGIHLTHQAHKYIAGWLLAHSIIRH